MKTALNDPEVDACIVATPTFTHEELIVASLDAGKHVFAEKPISETAEGTARQGVTYPSSNGRLFTSNFS